MSIISYIKISLAVLVFVILGYFVYEYKHMQTVIAAQQEQINALNLRAEVIEKAQKASDEAKKKMTVVKRRVVKENADVDQVVEANDNPHMQSLFRDHGLLQPQNNPPPSGAKGSPGHLSP